jgi:HD-like signal output (HDOD) protein
MTAPDTPVQTRPSSGLTAAARALGASGGGAGAARVLSLLYDPNVEIAAVLDCLRAEPGLAARVLKVANAPYYRQAGNIGTVDRAVAVLGLTAIRGVAASGCLDRLTPPRSGTAFDPDRFRLHSLAVACAAQELASATGAGMAGEAYMAGLLHDIGWLLLVKADPAAVARYQPPADADHAGVLAAEQAHFGTTHEACALLLTQIWAMPEWLAVSIVGHHAQADAATSGTPAVTPLSGLDALPGLLALADHAAQAAGFGMQAVGAVAAPPAGEHLGCAEAQLQALITALPDRLAALQAGP